MLEKREDMLLILTDHYKVLELRYSLNEFL